MRHLTYLVALLGALGAMVVADRLFRLFFFADARRAAVVLTAGTAYFLVWDVVGLQAGYFARGRSEWMSGVELGGGLAVEEPLFCAFLPYLAMNVHGALRRLAGRSA